MIVGDKTNSSEQMIVGERINSSEPIIVHVPELIYLNQSF